MFVTISFGSQEPLEPNPTVDPQNLRRSYVYAHEDLVGNFFYIGKGTGRRAWSKDRDANWHWYVKKHLAGEYRIRILADDLSSEEAELLEADWIGQCANNLVNWASPGRQFDHAALERFHALRDGNRALLKEAESIEDEDPERASSMYIRVIEAAAEYQSIVTERGLVSRLVAEQKAAQGITGISGEMWAIRRLAECLVKLGKPEEASQHVEKYLETYRADTEHHYWPKIIKRIETGIARARRKR